MIVYSKDPWNLTAASVVEEFLQLRFHLGEDLGVLFGHVFFFGRIFGKVEKSILGNFLPTLTAKQFVYLIIVGLLRIMSLQFPVSNPVTVIVSETVVLLDEVRSSLGVLFSKHGIHHVQAVKTGIIG